MQPGPGSSASAEYIEKRHAIDVCLLPHLKGTWGDAFKLPDARAYIAIELQTQVSVEAGDHLFKTA
ncbi:MAG: hypothetical protein FJ100_02265 [Deltaproteobacteria bacterium]|nr:hypothetical protein [Deltaproteobacteria bacterium]